jgi:hypothetical protein
MESLPGFNSGPTCIQEEGWTSCDLGTFESPYLLKLDNILTHIRGSIL